jgi:hypothetical protein
VNGSPSLGNQDDAAKGDAAPAVLQIFRAGKLASRTWLPVTELSVAMPDGAPPKFHLKYSSLLNIICDNLDIIY